jgi:hypothetical protein
MSSRLRAGTAVFGVSAVMLLALLLVTGVTGAPAKPAGRSCSVAGLRYAQKHGGATFSVAVAGLKAKVTTCQAARSIAGTVAKDILREVKVPARVGGLRVTVVEPCAGCTPDTKVTARSGPELVTFTVKGGA